MDRLRRALHNEKGMTLIEIVISLLILSVVALAAMQTALVSMNANLQNELRAAAVNIADNRMNEVREWDFDTGIVPNASIASESQAFRGFTKTYTSSPLGVQTIDLNTKQITITVTWQFRGQTYSHSISSIVRRQ